MRQALLCVLCVIGFAVLAACKTKTDVPLEFPTPPSLPAATPLGKLELKPDAELEARFAKIAEEAKGKVGVMAVVLETGESASLNADQRFPMQSVYKLPIAMAVMEQVRVGQLDLNEKIGVTKEDFVRQGMRSPLRDQNPNGGEFTIRELIRLSIVESDGTASDVLLRLVTPVNVQSFLTQIGVHDMNVVNTEKEIGRDWQTQYENWATPAASVELLRWLELARFDIRGADPGCLTSGTTLKKGLTHGACADIELVHYFMRMSIPGVKRLRGLLPASNLVAHKTGTGGARNGVSSATNDIGTIELTNGMNLSIAVYVSDSSADEKTREMVIAKIAKAAFDRWKSRPYAVPKRSNP